MRRVAEAVGKIGTDTIRSERGERVVRARMALGHDVLPREHAHVAVAYAVYHVRHGFQAAALVMLGTTMYSISGCLYCTALLTRCIAAVPLFTKMTCSEPTSFFRRVDASSTYGPLAETHPDSTDPSRRERDSTRLCCLNTGITLGPTSEGQSCYIRGAP